MLRALFEVEVTPDLVLGTSVGALNGAMVARDPTPSVIDRLTDLWQDASTARAISDRPLRTVRRAVSTGTHLYSAAPSCSSGWSTEFGETTFEELPVRFQVCAASIERAAEHWFTAGRLVDAIMASAAVPGLLPPAEVGGEHFLDGGIVNSIPLGRAIVPGRRPRLRAPGRPDRPPAEAAAGDRGRSPGSRSRSPGATASPASWPRCPMVSRCTCCPARGTSRSGRLAAGPPRLLAGPQPDRRQLRSLAGLPDGLR